MVEPSEDEWMALIAFGIAGPWLAHRALRAWFGPSSMYRATSWKRMLGDALAVSSLITLVVLTLLADSVVVAGFLYQVFHGLMWMTTQFTTLAVTA